MPASIEFPKNRSLLKLAIHKVISIEFVTVKRFKCMKLGAKGVHPHLLEINQNNLERIYLTFNFTFQII